MLNIRYSEKKLCQIIKDARIKLSCSIEDLADYCEITVGKMKKIESGEIIQPKEDVLYNVAQRLNIDILNLLLAAGYNPTEGNVFPHDCTRSDIDTADEIANQLFDFFPNFLFDMDFDTLANLVIERQDRNYKLTEDVVLTIDPCMMINANETWDICMKVENREQCEIIIISLKCLSKEKEYSLITIRLFRDLINFVINQNDGSWLEISVAKWSCYRSPSEFTYFNRSHYYFQSYENLESYLSEVIQSNEYIRFCENYDISVQEKEKTKKYC
jgi:transcriptional regulator with XRE-family HTH domain